MTGEPLFTEVLGAIEFRYAYRFSAHAAHSLRGVARLEATVAAPSGWHRTLALGSPTEFHGDHALIRGTLGLRPLYALLQRVGQMTEVSADSYTITIAPRVIATGSLDGQMLHATFSPESQFSLAEHEIEPRGGGGSAATSSADQASSSAANPFASSASGSVSGIEKQSRSISMGPIRLSVTASRALSLIGIAIVVCALLGARGIVARPVPREEAATIRARYGHLIVSVDRISQVPGVAVIDVADMDALARIAEHYDRSILHETGGQGDAFWVTDESGQFRYTVGAAASPTPGQLAEPVRPIAPAQPVAPESPTPERPPREQPTVQQPAVPGPTASEEPTVQQPAVPQPAASEQPATQQPAVPQPVAWEQPTVEQPAVPQPVAWEQPVAQQTVTPQPAAWAQPAAWVPPAADPPAPPQSATWEQPAAWEQPADASVEPQAAPVDGGTGDFPVEEVYADEMELDVIAYQSSRDGRPKRSNTSPTLTASTGSSG